MLPYRRFPLRLLLPSWWILPWALVLPLFLKVVFPPSAPARAEGIEWPIHDGGPCLGDVPQLVIPPLKPAVMRRKRGQLPYLPLPLLEKARPWRTVEFTGQPLTDFMGLQLAETYLRALAADTGHAGGVRLRFGPRVSYGCLFEVLTRNWANRPPTWWLDARHQPLTLYVVTFPPRTGPLFP